MPSFASCVENDYPMTGQSHGHVDLCGLSDRIAAQNATALDPGMSAFWSQSLGIDLITGASVDAYVGLYGGYSCAHYTLELELLDPWTHGWNVNCSTATTAVCAANKEHKEGEEH